MKALRCLFSRVILLAVLTFSGTLLPSSHAWAQG
jgi:hypothetical protein